MDNPYQSPLDDALAGPLDQSPREYGGIGRLAYVGWSLLLGLGFAAVAAASDAFELEAITTVAVIGSFFTSLYITGQRLKNMGWEAIWILLLFVPLVNAVVGFMLLICPAGFVTTRKLDTAGKVTAVTLLLCIPLGLIALSITK